jgi:uncharacterized protein DUF3306
MSEDFLKRWSRRKRDAVEAGQTKGAEDAEPADIDRSVDQSIDAVEATNPAINPAGPPEPAFDLKDLPPIESITAATDIRPFLAPGVPVDIARAALRRAWSADPRIRDFVGLADYDFDYHTVGGAAGFGPLEMTDELRRAVARIVGEIADADVAAPPGERIVGTESLKESQDSNAEMKAAPVALTHDPDQRSLGQVSPTAPAINPDFHDRKVVVLQHDGCQEPRRTTSRRGHGRALPK